MIEHLSRPTNILTELSTLLEDGYIRHLIISTPCRDRARGSGDLGPPENSAHVQEWTKAEFGDLLAKHKLQPIAHGFTRNHSHATTRNTQVALISSDIKIAGIVSLPKCLAFVPVYNEADIVADTLSRLLGQGLDVHVLDNWSTDGSFELVSDMAKGNEGLSIERFPDSATDEWHWFEMLERVETLSTQLRYDWFLHVDADERPEGFDSQIGLVSCIGAADRAGCDVIDFTLIELRPTLTSGLIELNHWEFVSRPGAKNMQRAWKNLGTRPDLKNSGGHTVATHSKIFPINFLLTHLPLRSPNQARKKIFKDRITRFQTEKMDRGWHTQYDSYVETDDFVWNSNQLLPPVTSKQKEFLPEVLTRSGINFS